MIFLLASVAATAQFGNAVTVAAPSADARDLVFADLSGNGLGDCAAFVESAGVVSTWLRRGDDQFQVGQRLSIGEGRDLQQLLAGDVDGDGDIDLVAYLTQRQFAMDRDLVAVLLNDGAGVLSPVSIVQGVPGTNTPRPGHLAVGDLEGDGVDEILFSVSEGFGTGRILRIDPLTGAATVALSQPAWSRFILLSDLDADGNDDLAFLAQTGSLG